MSFRRALFEKSLIVTLIVIFWSSSGNAQSDACLGKPVFVIETATVSECSRLLTIIAPYQKFQKEGITYYCGRFKGYPVLLTSTGIGEVYAAATNTLLISTYHPKFILFVGIAGKLTPQLKYGDVVVGSEVYQVQHLDMSIERVNRVNPNTGLVYSPLLKPKSEIIEFVKTFPSFKNFSVFLGRIATTNTYPESKTLIRDILKTGSKAVAMEDYAIIATCELLNANCLTVRAISDNPQKILIMDNENRYCISASERASAMDNLVSFVKVFLDKWLQVKGNLGS
ncbi:5'-methylthioadenosine/S-adenosylhomocysteine nucleosidase family protein [Legionella hackeliae]|nr:5'-methylthioadenosine/S-adenosylhomocysteine nucleosidase [Legionella hackeliae]KTD13118.1 5'-methylthioadenosine/S-adenosylhomocysteine nucleosidase [Legionella hackeliae]STX48344.1 5'-methylthioadenosine/S-adenosylhomocysteine nucleosidase [Legionella hackeliae]